MPFIDLTYNNVNIVDRPLNSYEIQKLNPDAVIYKYTELYQFDKIEELFKNTRKVIILYLLMNENVGHWTCLFLNQDGINFFDPYGVMPDFELELLSKDKRKYLNQEEDYLNDHLLKGFKVIYNNITYQREKTATCGCFVSHRLYYSNLNDPQYFSIFVDSKKKPDELVAEWCFSKLNRINY